MIKIARKRNWDTDCRPYIEKCPTVMLDQDVIEKIDEFSDKLIAAKLRERHYRVDNDGMKDRFQTGFMGEAALGKFLGVDCMDLTIGISHDYNKADLGCLGIECGIKTAKWDRFHMVHKVPKRPEIIIVKYDITYYICGLATVQVLEDCQDDKLVTNDKLRARGTKTGFHGYSKLLRFNNIDELKALL